MPTFYFVEHGNGHSRSAHLISLRLDVTLGNAQSTKARAGHLCQMWLCVLIKRLSRRQPTVDDIVSTLTEQANPACQKLLL